MNWTPEARESAIRAQPEYGDEIVSAIFERAEEIARSSGYDLIDTDLWFQALLDVRLPELEGQQEILS